MKTSDDKNSSLIENKIETIEKDKEAQEAKEKAIFKKNMEKKDFRIDYYTKVLDREYITIPNDNFYSAELEQITNKYKECKEKLKTLDTEEELKSVIDEFLKYKKSRINAKVIGIVLMTAFAVLFFGFILICILKGQHII